MHPSSLQVATRSPPPAPVQYICRRSHSPSQAWYRQITPSSTQVERSSGSSAGHAGSFTNAPPAPPAPEVTLAAVVVASPPPPVDPVAPDPVPLPPLSSLHARPRRAT